MNRMTIQGRASQPDPRWDDDVESVVVVELADSVEDRNRAYDEALAASEVHPPRRYPGPEAGCGHVRLVP
jgi:hypothetical protein